MSSILLTGAESALGRHILAELSNSYPDQNVYVMSSTESGLSDRYEMLALFGKLRPNTVIHLATTLRADDPWFEVADRINLDLLNMLALFESAASVGCKKFLTTASASTYPLDATAPLSEVDYMAGQPSRLDIPTTQVARTAVRLGDSYRWQFGMECAHIVHGLVFGELTQDPASPSLPDKIIQAIRRAQRLREKSVKLSHKGSALMDVVYAGNLARSIIATSMSEHGGVLNVSDGEVSVRAFAQSVAHALGFDGVLQFGESDIDSRLLSAEKDAGFNKEQLSMREALSKVAGHYEAEARNRIVSEGA